MYYDIFVVSCSFLVVFPRNTPFSARMSAEIQRYTTALTSGRR